MLRYVFVFSCAKMTPPLRPTASFAPVCSGCQCVLTSVWMRVASRRVLHGRKQRIGIGGETAIDHQCALRTRHRDHVAPRALEQRRSAEIRRRDSRSVCALAASFGSSAPPTAAALTCRNRRRDESWSFTNHRCESTARGHPASSANQTNQSWRRATRPSFVRRNRVPDRVGRSGPQGGHYVLHQSALRL